MARSQRKYTICKRISSAANYPEVQSLSWFVQEAIAQLTAPNANEPSAFLISETLLWKLKSYLMIYFVPLPFPSTAITPFWHISFSSFIVFDLPKGTYGATSLIGFNIVLLKKFIDHDFVFCQIRIFFKYRKHNFYRIFWNFKIRFYQTFCIQLFYSCNSRSEYLYKSQSVKYIGKISIS